MNLWLILFALGLLGLASSTIVLAKGKKEEAAPFVIKGEGGKEHLINLKNKIVIDLI